MNHYGSETSIRDVQAFQKDFENKFLSDFPDLFKNENLNREFPEHLLDGYNESYDEIFKSNKLLCKTKTLIAIAVAAAVYSPYCIESFYDDAKEYGWNTEQILEAIQAATAVRCGFTTVHAIKKLNDVQEMVI